MLTVSAFNALLKTLEEPPPHIKFIFATTEPNKVIATIQSRCQRFDFNNIAPAAIAGQLKNILKQEKIKFEEDLLLHLAKMANGSMRDALSLLDRLISTGSKVLSTDMLEEFLGSPNIEKIYNLVSNISLNEAAGTLEAVEDLISTGLSEVQIADALIECFRDLMVIKSTGVENKILVLTGEQKKRLAELAENFDVAAIVYQITTLEKLLWTLKNSESARALLEAAMLRFALSEHFMNVDALLSQVKGSGGASLKKKAISRNPAPKNTQPAAYTAEQPDLPLVNLPTKIDSVKDDWPNILNIIAGELGNGTAGLLTNAVPARFEDNVLTLRFAPAAAVQKKMCETGGRKEQLQSFLGRQWQTDLTLKFEVASEEEQADYNSDQQKTASQIRSEMINDPKVKTVLHGLGATVTGFEQNKKT
jgi:DNA polymerase-3 subunit gamma/tau